MPGRCASSTLCEALSREHFQDSWQELFCTGLRRTCVTRMRRIPIKRAVTNYCQIKKIELLFLLFEKQHIRKKGSGGVLVSRITPPYPGANHVAPPATKLPELILEIKV